MGGRKGGRNLQWTCLPSRESSNFLVRLMLKKPKISSDSVGRFDPSADTYRLPTEFQFLL